MSMVLTAGLLSGGSLMAAPAAQPEPGDPSRTIKGVLVKIEGRYYVVKDDTGKELRLLVDADTEINRGVKPGDRIEIRTAPVEHAMYIKAAPGKAGAKRSNVVRGQLVKIQGQFYVLKDEGGKEVILHVSKDTELAGVFRPGDLLEIVTSPLEHAMVIRPYEGASAQPPSSEAATPPGPVISK